MEGSELAVTPLNMDSGVDSPARLLALDLDMIRWGFV